MRIKEKKKAFPDGYGRALKQAQALVSAGTGHAREASAPGGRRPSIRRRRQPGPCERRARGRRALFPPLLMAAQSRPFLLETLNFGKSPSAPQKHCMRAGGCSRRTMPLLPDSSPSSPLFSCGRLGCPAHRASHYPPFIYCTSCPCEPVEKQ